MKIRVLYVQETVGSGGVEKRKLLMARFLDKDKYEIKLVCTFAKNPILKEFENMGVEVIPIGRFKNFLHLKQYLKVLNIIKDFKPHIIHGAVFEGVTIACVAGFIGKVPIIIAEETSDPQNRSKRASFLLKILTLTADKIVAIAPNVAKYLTQIAHISAKKIVTINNGVETPRNVSAEEIQALKEQYSIKDDDIVIGSVGRIHDDHKRFTDIIKALSFLPIKDNIKLLIVGGGRDEQLIKDTIKEYNLDNNVIMTGYQFDTAPYYKLMDIFCLASQREGFGLVVAEAMLNKLPVVATKVGGLQDVVVNNETGFLVPPRQPRNIAEKLQELIENPMLREKMKHAGYSRAIKEYTADIYAKKVENMYDELIKKNIKI